MYHHEAKEQDPKQLNLQEILWILQENAQGKECKQESKVLF
jgi:hypothetical protein